jgi:alpha-tubulin suppressor-like RCC1 family protein
MSSMFIGGTFSNLTNGQPVALSYGGILYKFVASYFGGTGNDLVVIWARNRPFAWGYNNAGQLGDSSRTQRQKPVPVDTTGVLAGKTVVALAAGEAHSLALCSDGTVAAWGDNTYGQLGDNTTNSHFVPWPVSTTPGVSALSGKTVVAVAAGRQHSLALCSDGTVAAWGRNLYGQLGDNSTATRLAPVAVDNSAGSALYGKSAVAISGGYYHSLALCWDGSVAAWGRNAEGQLGDNSGGQLGAQRIRPVAVNMNPIFSALAGKMVTAIAAGFFHCLAVCSDNTMAGWGQNTFGQLGNDTTAGSIAPVAVDTAYSGIAGREVISVAAGGFHSLAVCKDGTPVAWGANSAGQIGNTFNNDVHEPVVVNRGWGISSLAGKTPMTTSSGYAHSLMVCSDGTAVAWGANEYGQLGNDSTVQTNAAAAIDTTSLAAGERFSLVVSSAAAQHTLALVAEPPAPPIALTGAKTLPNGSFQFNFTNLPGEPASVVATTNPVLPLSQWTVLTGLTEVTPGSFQFIDTQAARNPARFYRVRSP